MAPPRVPVWDAVVRLLHWALAALVAIDLIRDDGDYPHRLIGYAAVGVVWARLLGGGMGRPPGRPACLFPRMPGTKAYLRPLWGGAPPRSLGHNPLGVWMAWLIWLLVLLLGLTGWMSR